MIKIFENDEFGQVRTLTKDNKEYFAGTDIAKALGYAIPSKAINTHCKGVSKMEVPTNGGVQEMLFITEGDIYRLIVKSKLPNAENFEKWIFDEVIPNIRKHGAYMSDDILEKALTSPDFLIQLATNLKKEQEERKRLEHANREKDRLLLVAGANQQLLNDFISSDSLFDIDTVSKILAIKGLGRNNFYKYLRDNKILMTDYHFDCYGRKTTGIKHYTAYANYTNECGYFKHRVKDYIVGRNTIHQNYAMFTPKGIKWIHAKLKRDGYIIEKDLEMIINELKMLKVA